MSAFRITDKTAFITGAVILVVICMRYHRRYILRFDNCITYRAMLTLGKSRCGTSGFDGIVDDLGMSLCGNSLLSHKNSITYRTTLTLGQACFGTSRRNGVINDLSVTVSGNSFFLTFTAG